MFYYLSNHLFCHLSRHVISHFYNFCKCNIDPFFPSSFCLPLDLFRPSLFHTALSVVSLIPRYVYAQQTTLPSRHFEHFDREPENLSAIDNSITSPATHDNLLVQLGLSCVRASSAPGRLWRKPPPLQPHSVAIGLSCGCRHNRKHP